MKIRKPIRNLRSNKDMPPRVFDVVIEGDRVDLEVKFNKERFERISWDDVVHQVELAKSDHPIN